MKPENKLLIPLKIIIPIVLVFGMLITACDIDEGLNNSPNAISDASVKTVDGINSLAIGLQVNVGDVYTRDRSRINSIWAWQMCAPPGIARPQPASWNSYVLSRDGEADDYWLYGYRGVRIANDIIEYAPDVFAGSAGRLNTLLGMAKSCKALLLGEFAAIYGSIPITIVGKESPKFVSQKDAYAEVQKLLTEAIAHFASGDDSYNRDLNFKGSKAKWTAVAHSLKARYYLHVKDYPNALAESNSGIADATGSLYGIFSSKSGEFASWGQWVQNESEPIRGEKYFVDLLKSESGDKRLAEYYSPNSSGEYYGYAVHQASLYPTPIDTNEQNFAYTVRMKKYSQFGENFPLIRYEENVLIKAECLARAGSNTAAATEVNKIRTKAGLPDYSGSDLIKEVLKQKFLELYLEGQAYHDMRRTGTLPEPYKWDGSKTNLRWIYGESEMNANPNVPPDADALVNDLLFDGYK